MQAVNKFRIISGIVFCGVFLGIVRAYFQGTFLGDVYPLNTFLFDPIDRFNDLLNMVKICSTNNPYFTFDPFPSNYFPFANTALFAISLIGNKTWMIIVFLGAFVILYGWLIANLFKDFMKFYFLEIVIIFFFSYPVLFNVDRLNIEMYNFLCCFLWIYCKEKNKTFLLALFLCLSISMKLYTGVFVILYLKEKRFKELFLIPLVVGILSLLSLSSFQGGIMNNVSGMLSALKG